MIIQSYFKNREKELEVIREYLRSNKFELLIIYGRRRIGKTELILEATKNVKKIYYLATTEKNLERFYSLCSKHFPEISKLKMDWEVLFDYLKDKVDVIIIDEFQNLIEEDKNIISVFQSIVDLILKNSKVKLFLIGSSVSMITSHILSYKSPLYGRRTGSMEIGPISFFDLKKFFPNFNVEQLIEIFGFADGIPFYLVKINKEFWTWLEEELKRKDTFLKDEVDFIMKYEFEDTSTYKLILEAIAFGKTKINEIKDYIGVKRTDITPYLKNLIEVKMVKRLVPITEKEKSRYGRYYISDNFLKFWFRYIYENLSSIEEGIFDVNTIKQNYNVYLGEVFEEVCRQFLIRNREKIFPFTKIGKWWYKDKEIDIVAFNEQSKEILFCECKWKEEVNAKEILQELKEKAQYVDWNKNERKEYYAIFAKNFKKKAEDKNVFHFELNDIEECLNS
ncbi:MAG: ATP-binding protein [Thermoproteota archaeon]|nr:ATP-binding protein [Thermoproteota archaeon]